MIWIVLPLITLVSGMVHTITGFGSGVVMMLVFPYILNMVAGPALVSAINFFLSLTLAYKFRKELRPQLIVFPVIPYLICSIGTIMALKHLDLRILAIAFGFFLIVLSLYFIFIAKHMSVKANWRSAVVCGAFSGAGAGLFGIGGPLMALYFLAITDSKESYTANLQCFFTITCLGNTIARVTQGLYTMELVPLTILGLIFVNLGKRAGLKVLDRLDADLIRKIVYIFVGLSGVLTVVQNLLG